ncbi:MAG: urea ABC transporter permease subunit UrtC [Proteobacteria bacterium]|nr:urea ABC transporter permease subunit UrtC [Pseudomonadota bacterium]
MQSRAKKLLLEMHTPRQWLALAAVAGIVLVAVPVLNLATTPTSALRVSDHLIPLFGKFLCFALVAVAVDLLWGFAGILSLGYTVFFACGGYTMGMYLMRAIGRDGVYRNELPDFMVFLDWHELPWYWRGFDSLGFAIAMALLVPGIIALVFGYFAFRSRIRGVYFSIITQAFTYASMLLFFRNETGFGGNNGLTDFKRIAGLPLHEQSTKVSLYIASGFALLLGYLLCRYVVCSKLGRVLVALRDQELRVMFAGYSPLKFKLFAWTLSAILCGLAGALYVPQVGIINPNELAPSKGIEMAVWVAVGGRGTLAGAAVGAVAVNGAKSWLTAAHPEYWLYVLGSLFIAVTLFLPRGLVGHLAVVSRRITTWRKQCKLPRISIHNRP